MSKTRTIDDAAAVFSALRGDQVVVLLSRLKTNDAQRLLATAAKLKPTANDLERATSLLTEDLSKYNKSSSHQDLLENGQPSRSSHQNQNTGSTNSLDILINLSDRDIRILLSKVSTACWAPALKSESDAVREIILRNVAPAIKCILQREILMFEGNLKSVQSAREKIINAANDLQRSAASTTRKNAG